MPDFPKADRPPGTRLSLGTRAPLRSGRFLTLRPTVSFALVICSFGVGPFHLDAVAQLKQARGSREIVRRSEPAYPLIARRARLTGKVRLQVKVGADGRVASIVVLGGNPFFVKAGMEAAVKWRWERATGDTEEFVQLTFENP